MDKPCVRPDLPNEPLTITGTLAFSIAQEGAISKCEAQRERLWDILQAQDEGIKEFARKGQEAQKAFASKK